MLSERMQQQSRKDNYQASIAIALSISGGEIGGTAASWYTDDEVSKAFLEVAWDTLSLPSFLEGRDCEDTALVELLLLIDAKNSSFEVVDAWADVITDLNTPASLKPWIIACKYELLVMNEGRKIYRIEK